MQAYQSETLQYDKVIDENEPKWHAEPRTVSQTLSGIDTCHNQHISHNYNSSKLDRNTPSGMHAM